jgi:hypothetical protein
VEAREPNLALPERFELPKEPIRKHSAGYSIGFLKLVVHERNEDAICAGSGTLVTVGSLHGILTAAHVVDALPKEGAVGIAPANDGPTVFHKQQVMMEQTEPIIIRADEFGPDGPDLAFLRLPQETIGWLAAKSLFYNLMKRREDILADKKPGVGHGDSICGTIDLFTEEVPTGNPGQRQKMFSAAVWSAIPVAKKGNEFDIIEFEIRGDARLPLPDSIAGTSGGSVWRSYVREKDGKPEIFDYRLIGVPFHETPIKDGKKVITCHGPKGIYGTLIDAVFKRWPDAAS